jgi:hypothetical protein
LTAPIPEALARSPLLARGGYQVFDNLLDPAFLQTLREEAGRLVRYTTVTHVSQSDGTEGRGGNPARCFFQGEGHTVQDEFYRSPEMATLLTSLCNTSVATTGARGTFSYYAKPGHHLALHRDIVTCDVAVLTCVFASASGCRGLYAYPRRWKEPLSAIRATPGEGIVSIELRTGQTVVLMGGIVPHTVLPQHEGQVRIMSVLCYRAIT